MVKRKSINTGGRREGSRERGKGNETGRNERGWEGEREERGEGVTRLNLLVLVFQMKPSSFPQRNQYGNA